MSCWVVPTIAAELWGVSVDHILQQIREGRIAHRMDEGFMFVDVAPNSPRMGQPPPSTYTMIEAEQNESEDDAPLSIDADEETSAPIGDWRSARQRTGVLRTPPVKRVA